MLCLNVSQLSFEWQEMLLERIQEVAIELGNQLSSDIEELRLQDLSQLNELKI